MIMLSPTYRWSSKVKRSTIGNSCALFFVIIVLNIADGNPHNTDPVRAAEELESQIELTISLINLPGPAFAVDVRCITHARPVKSDRWIMYDRSDKRVGANNLTFVKKVRIPYLLKDMMELMFEIHNDAWDLPPEKIDKKYLQGYAECTLAELMRAGKMEMPLKSRSETKRNLGLLVIHAEKLVNDYDEIVLQLRGVNLATKRWLRTPKQYIEIYKRFQITDEEYDYVLVYRSEKQKNTFSPEWNQIVIPMNSLCNGDRGRVLKFMCRDRHDLIGEFKTTVATMSNKWLGSSLENPKQKSASVGKISVLDFNKLTVPSFAKLIADGLRLRCIIGVDFSRANIMVKSKQGTLHYNSVENKYRQAIRSIGAGLEDYISEKKFHIFGFAARNKNGGPLDCFNLDNGYSNGIDGMLNAYENTIPDINLGASINITALISRAHEFANREKWSSYFILLLLMCGDVSDDFSSEYDMKDKLKETMKLPVSIVVVNMCDSKFSILKELYNELSKEVLEEEFRDMMHYVSFNKSTSYSYDNEDARRYLGAEILAELPSQVVSYKRPKIENKN